VEATELHHFRAALAMGKKIDAAPDHSSGQKTNLKKYHFKFCL
jgi:hypothetical protein